MKLCRGALVGGGRGRRLRGGRRRWAGGGGRVAIAAPRARAGGNSHAAPSGGQFSAYDPGEVKFTGGTYTLGPGTTFTGSGTATVAGATVTVRSTVSAGKFQIGSGKLTGAGDLMIRAVARSNGDLQRVIGRIVGAPGIVRTSTVIALATAIPYRTVPLVQAAVATDDATEEENG